MMSKHPPKGDFVSTNSFSASPGTARVCRPSVLGILGLTEVHTVLFKAGQHEYR